MKYQGKKIIIIIMCLSNYPAQWKSFVQGLLDLVVPCNLCNQWHLYSLEILDDLQDLTNLCYPLVLYITANVLITSQ